MTDFWKETKTEQSLEDYKIIELKQELLVNDRLISDQEKRRDKAKNILNELFNKLEQLNYLKQTESLDEYPSNQEEKDKLVKKLSFRAREYQMSFNILKQIKHKYEINLLHSESPYSRETLTNLLNDNSDLKLKIKTMKIKNTNNMKEIENLQHKTFYQTAIISLQNELKQLIFKQNEHNSKIIKDEKSISIMKGIFLSLIKEKTEELLKTEKGQEFIRENRLEDLKLLLPDDNFIIDDAIKILSVNLEYLLNDNKPKVNYNEVEKKPMTHHNKIRISSPLKINYILKTKPNSRAKLKPIEMNRSVPKTTTPSYVVINSKGSVNNLLKSTKSTSEHANEDKNKSKQQKTKTDDKIDYLTITNHKYNELLSNLDNFTQVNNQLTKTLSIQNKLFKKKFNETTKLKDTQLEKLQCIKDENDLLNKEIEYLNQQYEEYTKELKSKDSHRKNHSLTKLN